MPRRQEPPVDSSWRMVDGDNDSFDTTHISAPPDGDEGPCPNTHFSSQLSQLSQVGSSQGSIGDFVARAGADDERVLMRTPFRPTMPPGEPKAATTGRHKSSEPDFRMPMLSVEGVPSPKKTRMDGIRRRPVPRVAAKMTQEEEEEEEGSRTVAAVVAAWLPVMFGGIAAWALGVVTMSFRMAQRPLSLLVALYLFLSAWTVVQNMATRSVTASLQPFCRFPGVSYLDLSFCDGFSATGSPWSDPSASGKHQNRQRQVKFDALMGVQSQFERVLERTAEGVSLPLEMRYCESSVRDLRTLVRYSQLPVKAELILELDGFINATSRAVGDLQRFNIHVGSAVDSILLINRLTARYINNIAEAQRAMLPGSLVVFSWLPVPLDEWSAWALSLFQSAPICYERILIDKYVEHTAAVSGRITKLLAEAEALLGLLERADDHLHGIHDVITRQGHEVRSHLDVLLSVRSFFGKNRRAIHRAQEQLELLKQVGLQRQSAIALVRAVVHDLEKIQAELADLQDRVAEPTALHDDGDTVGDIPLSVHVETIGNGVERLNNARRRLRDLEDDKIKEVLGRERVVEWQRQIEAQ